CGQQEGTGAMRRGLLTVSIAALLIGGAACGNNSTSGSTTASGSATAAQGGKTIALFLPESKTTRYEAFDRPLFEAKLKALCADCKLLYFNADQDAAKQQS